MHFIIHALLGHSGFHLMIRATLAELERRKCSMRLTLLVNVRFVAGTLTLLVTDLHLVHNVLVAQKPPQVVGYVVPQEPIVSMEARHVLLVQLDLLALLEHQGVTHAELVTFLSQQNTNTVPIVMIIFALLTSVTTREDRQKTGARRSPYVVKAGSTMVG